MKRIISTTVMIAVFTVLAYGQNRNQKSEGPIKDNVPNHKFSVCTPWLIFDSFGPEKTNAYMLVY